MTPEDMADFQNKLKKDLGHTIRVRVEKQLSAEEREALINHIRYKSNDFDATVEIIEPNLINFDFEVIPSKSNKLEEHQEVNDSADKNVEHKATDKKDSSNWVYGQDLVVMQNRLLNAITDLSHNERRLIMLLSPKVRAAVDEDPSQRTFEVTALEFSEEYELKADGTYKTLSEISSSLLQKAFWFYDFKTGGVVNKKGSSWVAECEYLKGQGRIAITLTDTVTHMLTVFDKSNPFTKYERRYIVQLGSYGIIMFELASSCLYLKGSKKYTVEYLRQKFNCTDKYAKVTDFKTKVLDKAIAEVQEHTPLSISYTENKVGREITEIVFSIRDSSNVNIENIVKVFSKSEISKYGWQLKGEHEVVGNFPQSIQTPSDTQKEIERRMADPKYYKEYLRHLKKITDFDEEVHLKNLKKKANAG